MLVPLVAALQIAGPAAGSAAPERLGVPRPCPADTEGGEVVVCGRRSQEQFRLRPIPPRYEAREGFPPAEIGIGNAKVGVRAEDSGVGGFTSHRLMAGVKLPF